MKIDVDALAQEIRRVDGCNSLGAGSLAEAIAAFLDTIPANPAQVTEEMVETAARAYAEHQHGKGCPVWEEELPPMRAALTAAIGAGNEPFQLVEESDDVGTQMVVAPAIGAGRQAVVQFRKVGCSDWYDGLPDNEDGRGPYETRTLYTHPVQPGWRPTHRHKKRGGEYMLLGIGKMQTSNWMDEQWSHEPQSGNPPQRTLDPVDMSEVAIYRGEDGKLWVRPREEFEDGRFEALPAAPQPKGE